MRLRRPTSSASITDMLRALTATSRLAFLHAAEQARSRGERRVDGTHLLLALVSACNPAIGVSTEAVGRHLPTAGARCEDAVMIDGEVEDVLQAVAETLPSPAPESIRPEQLLLALLDRASPRVLALLRAAQVDLDQLRSRAAAAVHLASSAAAPVAPSGSSASPPRGDVAAMVRDARRRGDPVAVHIGRRTPIGDLGHVTTDAQMLLAILAAEGRFAGVLAMHGLDEARVRAGLEPPPAI